MLACQAQVNGLNGICGRDELHRYVCDALQCLNENAFLYKYAFTTGEWGLIICMLQYYVF